MTAANRKPLGGVMAEHDDYCCPGLAVLEREVALNWGGIAKLMEEQEKRYMQRFDAQDESVKTALISAKEAVIKAEIATEKRFDAIREETDTRIGILERDIAKLSEAVSSMIGRSAGGSALWGYLVGAAGMGAAIIGIILAFSR